MSKTLFSQSRQTWALVNSSDCSVILTSCETYKRPFVMCHMDSGVTQGYCFSIASVFTELKHRGKGYASKMIHLLKKLIPTLDEFAFASNLFSDIGKEFYSQKGWIVHSSEQGEIQASYDNLAILDRGLQINSVAINDIGKLVVHDVAEILNDIQVEAKVTRQRIVSILPTHKNFIWIYERAGLYAQSLGVELPLKMGVSLNDKFVFWTHDFKEKILLITRIRCQSDADLLSQFMCAATEEAMLYGFTKVVLWNPIFELCCMERVHRIGSIPSMCLFNRFESDSCHWIANEKFGWV